MKLFGADVRPFRSSFPASDNSPTSWHRLLALKPLNFELAAGYPQRLILFRRLRRRSVFRIPGIAPRSAGPLHVIGETGGAEDLSVIVRDLGRPDSATVASMDGFLAHDSILSLSESGPA